MLRFCRFPARIVRANDQGRFMGKFSRRIKQGKRALCGAHATQTLCRCGDEIAFYASDAEAEADTRPALICEHCHRPRARVAIITDAQLAAWQRVGLAAMVTDGRLTGGEYATAE